MADAPYDANKTVPLVAPGHTFRTITEKISSVVLTPKTPLAWFVVTFIGFNLLMAYPASLVYPLMLVVGIWGNNVPGGWASPIINFVWWLGIGHAGTLISAILLLLKQDWRTSINRFAEAMTIFAV